MLVQGKHTSIYTEPTQQALSALLLHMNNLDENVVRQDLNECKRDYYIFPGQLLGLYITFSNQFVVLGIVDLDLYSEVLLDRG